MTMSDWTGVYSTTESIKAGLDLEMPGPTTMRGKTIERALNCEKLFPSDIDACVRKILELLKRAYASKIPFNGPEEGVDTPALRALLREAAASATVLLKNDHHVLPLPTKLGKIAVLGPNAKLAMPSGGGSARLLSTYTVSPLEAITAHAKEIGAEVVYSIGAASYKCLPLLDAYISLPGGGKGALVEFWSTSPTPDFLSPKANVRDEIAACAWSTPTKASECFMNDGIVRVVSALYVASSDRAPYRMRRK